VSSVFASLSSFLSFQLQLTKMRSLGFLKAGLVRSLEFPDAGTLSFFKELALMESGKLDMLRERGVRVSGERAGWGRLRDNRAELGCRAWRSEGARRSC
jgi:hypothetical protein